LVYVEWFTPFRTADPVTGMYIVTKSSRNHRAYGQIIEAHRLVRNCHLMPKSGR
ncbi:hypothetical protein BDW22DRAFT_1297819, partial [Trametopsis cervina]